MKHAVSLAVTLFSLWLLLSGHYTPLLIGLGLASTALTVFLALRMDVIDHESHPIHLSGRLVRFWLGLLWQIVLANLAVAARVLGLRRIGPRMIRVPVPQHTDLGRVIYANAITLTPGTVSVQLDRDSVTVHALCREDARSLEQGTGARAVPENQRGVVG